LRLRGGGGADQGYKLFRFFAEVKGFARGVVVGVSAAQACGPFELEITLEEDFDFEGVFGFDFKFDEGTWFVDGGEEGFADIKSVAGVEDGDGFGMRGDGAGEGGGVEDARVGVNAEVEVAEDF